MKKLESPYTHMSMLGLSKDFNTKREVKALWEKVDEIVDWINERKKEDKKKYPV